MAQNMYRVGDYVYFEISSAAPFQVRRIEELNKTASGNVEAKVLCFYRRRDIPLPLLKIADRAERTAENGVINVRRRLCLSQNEVNGDAKLPVKSEDGGSGESSSNGNGEKSELSREDSESPKPMQVDVKDEDDNAKEDKEPEQSAEGGYGLAGLPKGSEELSSKKRHLLRQHELFLSRQIEALPATHIRGKCTVTLLSEVETPDSYLGRDDAFFYSLVYDPFAQTLLADKGEIRVGEKYQCDVPEEMEPDALDDNKENGNLVIDETVTDGLPVIETTDREVLVYHPHHSLTDRDIDQFLIIARAVGTFSRALDTSSSVKLPSLHMTAAAASRDVTLLHAMALLHQANYDIGQAVKYLVPPPSKQHYPLDADKTTSHNTVSLGGPILCRDQMEEWSAAEANLFEEAIEKYGKDFNDIRGDFLPWKSLRDIIEYYYMWKTTNRYVEIKKSKALEQESKLKQVYIPNYNKPNPNLVGPPNPSGHPVKGSSPCESCQAEESTQWYAWGPAHLQLRLCCECWTQWKKNGGLKRVHEYESYDLDGASSQDMLNPAQQTQLQKPVQPSVLAPGNLNRNAASASATTPRNGGISGRTAGGQIIARLPSNQQQQQQTILQQKLTNASSTLAVGPKTRVAFYLNTTLSMRIARRLAPKSLLNVRRSARRPFLPINGQAIKQYCMTRKPMEIINAARQIKGDKMSDMMLAQLAASIISSGSQLAAQPSPLTGQKRVAHTGDKNGGPTAKRQHSQSSHSLHHREQQQQQFQQAHSTLPSQQQHTLSSTGAAELLLQQQLGTQLRASTLGLAKVPQSKTAVTTSSITHNAPDTSAKPVATVVPISVPTTVNLANLKNAKNSAAVILSQHSSLANMASMFGGVIQNASKDATMSSCTMQSASTTTTATSAVVKKGKSDSRWSCIDERVLFLAGPKFKTHRKKTVTRRLSRSIALHPCRNNDFINKNLPSLQLFFR